MKITKKEVTYLLVSLLVVFIVGTILISLSWMSWNPVTKKEQEKFAREMEEEDIIFFFKEGGIYSMKIITVFPQKIPMAWLVRTTAQSEKGHIFRKYSLWFEDPYLIESRLREAEKIRPVGGQKTYI